MTVKWEVRGFPTMAFLNGIAVSNKSYDFYAGRDGVFDEGTKCELVDNLGDMCAMKGLRDKIKVESICFYDEFLVYDKSHKLVSEPKDVPIEWKE
jgi:hypothetical protein